MFFLKKQYFFCLFISLFFIMSNNLFANNSGSSLYEKGKTYYSNGEYLEALYFFKELSGSEYSEFHGDALFWSAKSYLASGDIENAEKDLEYFLLNFPRNRNYNEGFYYKGRILFMQKEYEKSLELFNRFIRSNPFSPFASNAYFWIGDCLYNTGNFDEALDVFNKVINDYPSSFKFEAAKYKISLIDYRFREEELLRLIRWSHEEAMNTIEEYRARERNSLQIIEAYQDKIIKLESGEITGEEQELLQRLKRASEELEKYLEELKNEYSESDNSDEIASE